MSSAERESERVDQIRESLRRINREGATYEEIGDAVGVSGSAVHQFVKPPHRTPKDATLERMEAFVKGGHAAAAGQRKTLAELLRWFADMLERDDPIPWIRLTQPGREGTAPTETEPASGSDEGGEEGPDDGEAAGGNGRPPNG